jgi:hypothetical protein
MLQVSIVLIYLLYLTKDLVKKKKITMVKPFAGSSGMDILNIVAPPPSNPFAMGSPRTHTKDFIQLLKPAKKKIN